MRTTWTTLALAAAIGAGCGDSPNDDDDDDDTVDAAPAGPTERSLTIVPYLDYCLHAGEPYLCTRAIDENGDEDIFGYFIPGFVFRWGFATDLRLNEYVVEDPDDDQPWFDYELIEVQDQREDPVGTRYTLRLHEPSIVIGSLPTPDVVDIDGYSVACDPAVCEALLAAELGLTIELEYTGDLDVPLRAVSYE